MTGVFFLLVITGWVMAFVGGLLIRHAVDNKRVGISMVGTALVGFGSALCVKSPELTGAL